MSTQSYPLSWPQGFPRTPPQRREAGQFKTSYANAIENVRKSLRLFGSDSGKAITEPVLSSNIDFLGNYNGDPGVAVWFTWDTLQVCIPVDRYSKPAANLQAIHHIIEARRVELRHGTLSLVRASFQGFKALPAPKGQHWTDILGVPATGPRSAIEAAYRDKARAAHPDAGGSSEAMASLNAARDAALQEIPNGT